MLTRDEGMMTPPDNVWCRLHGPAVIGVTFPARPEDDDIRAFVAALQAWSATVDRPYMFLLDLAHVLELSSAQRTLLAEAEATYETVDRRYNAGQALLATSSVQRGLITAFNWVITPVWPSRVVRSVAEADAWLDKQWQRVTVDYPDGPEWRGRLRR